MVIEQVKGFKDFSGEQATKRAEIKKIIVETFENYGFEPAETPVIEYEKFVKSQNQQDEIISDIFKLKDKGKRKLALRYEFTFQLKRLAKNKKLPYKRYQIGPVFRDEPVSSNRFKQFTQCDIDTIGSTIKDEAEILATTKSIFDKLNIKFTIYFNNRKLLNEILEEQGIKQKEREQVIREIDKLDKLSETEIKKNLKKYKADKLLLIFKKPESYFKKFSSYKEIQELKKYLNYYNIKQAKFRPSLARGLSYYNATIFEIKTANTKESIAGGGSYKINNIQSTGISFGLDRLEKLAKNKKQKSKILIISLNQDKQAIKLAEKLRTKGKNCMIYYGKPSKALQYANSYGINEVIFVGEKEIKAKKYKIKDMKTGKENFVKI